MKKQAFFRGLIGVPIGITIGYLITIFISLGWGNGYYSPCVPSLEEQMGSEINAVILQTVLCGILGAVFGAISIIWELDSWSIVKQTGIYFLIGSISMMPIAYINHWMEHSIGGFLSYFWIFIVIFIVAWIIQYIVWRQRIKKINESISDQ